MGSSHTLTCDIQEKWANYNGIGNELKFSQHIFLTFLSSLANLDIFVTKLSVYNGIQTI